MSSSNNNGSDQSVDFFPQYFASPPLIEVPTSYKDPPLYRIQPYNVAKPYYFKHDLENRFSLQNAPCCYLSDDYETAFKEAMHYLIKMALKAKELKQGRPVLSRKALMNKGVWTLTLQEKVTLFDLTVENIRNRFGISYHPGYESDYQKVRDFAQAAKQYSQSNPNLKIYGFYYPTQNAGQKAIALWESAIPVLESSQWTRIPLWNVIEPFLNDIARDFYVSFSAFGGD